MGPLIIDVKSTCLTTEECALISHPLVGGVILFSRNFDDKEQLLSLTTAIADLRPDCIVCTDHEGGRVQRFKHNGFTHLPAMGKLKSEEHAYSCGVVAAYELKSAGVHVNFAPVLDRDNGSIVIGDRGFGQHTDLIISRAKAFIEGAKTMNMMACGKHFPGHGSVSADSHVDCPVDDRSLQNLENDIAPFKSLIEHQLLDAIMPAHVVYPCVDVLPAGYSKVWLRDRLSLQLGFTGVVFSDDLSMKGASVGGSYPERAVAAYRAGCDFLLLCNAPSEVAGVIETLEKEDFRSQPNCEKWFSSLPQNADSLYREALGNVDMLNDV